MPTKSNLNDNQRVVYVTGAIVLCCQQIELLLKYIVPHLAQGDSNLSSVLLRHAKLERRPLGDVAGKFVEGLEGDAEHLRAYVQRVVDRRNELVHHFTQRYGDLLRAGNHGQVLGVLRQQHEDAVGLMRLLSELAVHLSEALRDTTFAGTDEYAEFSEVCAQARASLVGDWSTVSSREMQAPGQGEALAKSAQCSTKRGEPDF